MILFNNLNNLLLFRIKGINLKKANIIILVLLLSSNLFLISGISNNVSVKGNVSFNTTSNPKSIISNTNSAFEIDIDSDKNLTDYGFPGEGTLENPYRIENYRIDTSQYQAISICNTTKYIVVQNCSINAERIGLYLADVKPGTVRVHNNSFIGNILGLILASCSDIKVLNNTFEQNLESIHIGSTVRIDISHNIFRNNEYGIRSHYSGENNVFTNIINNYFYENYEGIECAGDLNDFNIHNNSFLNNDHGIYVSSRYEINGLYSNITYNLIENSTAYGISINGGIETTIHHNTLVNNNLNDKGTSQAFYDGYEKVVWYDKETREGNYWSDWNGILAYKIEGESNGKDKYPLTKPVHEVQTDIPKFFVGRVVMNSTIIPLTVISLGVIIYIFVKRGKKQ